MWETANGVLTGAFTAAPGLASAVDTSDVFLYDPASGQTVKYNSSGTAIATFNLEPGASSIYVEDGRLFLANQPNDASLLPSPPVDPNDTNTVTENTVLAVDAANGLLNGATDADGDTLTITEFTIPGVAGTHAAGDLVTIPGVGTVQIFADGAYTFGPVAGYTARSPSSPTR